MGLANVETPRSLELGKHCALLLVGFPLVFVSPTATKDLKLKHVGCVALYNVTGP